jgi:predicted ATPase
MLTLLKLNNFKGFRDATLKLGPFSLVIGANASGKSNLRDALRFLHGIARGYNLAEIIGEKYGEGGYREWSGLRGGVREVCRYGTNSFTLGVEFVVSRDERDFEYAYSITVEANGSSGLRVIKESLYQDKKIAFDSHPSWYQFEPSNPQPGWAKRNLQHIAVQVGPTPFRSGNEGPNIVEFLSHQPVLTQIGSAQWLNQNEESVNWAFEDTIRELEAMRFVDFLPDAMRKPSVPGQIVLSDQGENLSSVLQAICQNSETKEALLSWVEQLTPMDVADFDFVPDAQGKILVHLIEKDGQRISAYSASDGTLRFLGILAAFLGPKPARFYFLEELDTGIHPARLFLLMNLLEARSGKGGLQIFSTTHSPQMLRLIRKQGLEFASLTYRVDGVPETRIKSLPEIPHLLEVLKGSDIARLYEGGWMEQTMFFEEGEAQPQEATPADAETPADLKS